MSSLDNFHTDQGAIRRPHYPSYVERMHMIQRGVQSSKSSMWDIANTQPIAPVQPHDPGVREPTNTPDPQYVERISTRGMRNHLVPLRPHAERLLGDTADGVLLYQKPVRFMDSVRQLWSRKHTPVTSQNRHHPYLQKARKQKWHIW